MIILLVATALCFVMEIPPDLPDLGVNPGDLAHPPGLPGVDAGDFAHPPGLPDLEVHIVDLAPALPMPLCPVVNKRPLFDQRSAGLLAYAQLAKKLKAVEHSAKASKESFDVLANTWDHMHGLRCGDQVGCFVECRMVQSLTLVERFAWLLVSTPAGKAPSCLKPTSICRCLG
jgi:hypothetical protein